MEKIKAALAKVKLEKSGQPTKKRTRKTTTEPTSTGAGRDIGHISYTTTKVVKLDSEHWEQNRIVAHLDHNAIASVFDSLRTQVLQKMEENGWKTIAVVSPSPDSGKSVVSVNLAMSIAHQTTKTSLLVDFDLRKPKIAKYLGIDVEQSMNEFLDGKASLSDVLINPDWQRLVVLPTMRPVARSSEILSSSKVTDLIAELKTRYESRIIVFDLPPVLSTDDALALLPQVDCILLVVGNGVSTLPEIQDTMHLLPKENLVGVVYNKAEEENKAYYY